jgi:hypothetical protein
VVVVVVVVVVGPIPPGNQNRVAANPATIITATSMGASNVLPKLESYFRIFLSLV